MPPLGELSVATSRLCTRAVLYPTLISVQGLALLVVTHRMYTASGQPDRWLYIGLVPYHATTLLATAVCLTWFYVEVADV